MLIFDVDGVITNPQEKKITEPEILDEVIKRLEGKELIALNTGRSITWVKERVLNLLIEKAKNKEILRNLFIVGEKGGTWAGLDDRGNLIESKDDNISAPDDLKDKIRNLINTKYSESMFYDESKLTMITAEMNDGYNLNDYREKQKILSSELGTILADKDLTFKFKVDPTTIATDVENKFVGKHFAVKRIINWLKSKKNKPQAFITLGDSFYSDIPMAEEIHSQGFLIKFVYVGKEDIDVSKYPFEIEQTKSKFGKGTLEFLRTL
jgi:ribonucleotide monophosphatase NagD (HAD superfamily)